MAVPTFGMPMVPGPFDYDLEGKAAATEVRRHQPMLSAMQALSTENEKLKAEIERLNRGTRVTTSGPDAEEKARHAEQLKKFIELSSKIDVAGIKTMPLPMTGKVLRHSGDTDMIIIDELEEITGIEAVEQGRRAKPTDESAKGFEWEGAWDDDVLPGDTTP